MSGPVSPNPGDVPELWWSPIHGLVREKDGVWARYEEHTVTLRYYGLPNERPADAVRLILAGQGVRPEPPPPGVPPFPNQRHGQLYGMSAVCTCSHHKLQHSMDGAGACLRFCNCTIFESVTHD